MNTQADTLKITMLVLFFLTFLYACDKIEEPMMIVNVQDIPDNISDTLFFSDSVFVDQKQVLLEEFTGHLCVNCPEAAIFIHGVSAQNDHRLIIYSVHAGFYAVTESTGHYTTDFTCPAGIEIFNYFGEPFNPTATVNRVSFNGNQVLLLNSWENAFHQEVSKPNVADMKLKNTWFPNLNQVLINLDVTFNGSNEGKIRVVVIIVEDHIVSPQKNNKPDLGPAPDWLDYEHRNIVRDAITPTFGTYLSSDGTIVQGEVYSKTFFYGPATEWVTANCNIIAYVYDEDSEEILQVAELGIKTGD
jgi:hypothetical protein